MWLSLFLFFLILFFSFIFGDLPKTAVMECVFCEKKLQFKHLVLAFLIFLLSIEVAIVI